MIRDSTLDKFYLCFFSGKETMMSGSPSKILRYSSLTTPTKFIKKNICGTILSIGVLKTAKTGHSFFDIFLQIAKNDFATITIMNVAAHDKFINLKMKNVTLINVTQKAERKFYNERCQSRVEEMRHAVDYIPSLETMSISSITDETSEVFHVSAKFFWINQSSKVTKSGGVCKEAVVKDNSGEKILTVWNESVIDSLTDGMSYNILNITCKIYNGLKLSTTKAVVFEAIPDITDIATPNMSIYRLYSPIATFEKPTVVAAIVTMKFICKNRRCNYEVEKPSDATKFVSCINCGNKMLVHRLKESIDVVLSVESSSSQFIQVSTDSVMLRTVMNEECFSDKDNLEESILCLELTAMTYDKTTMRVVSFKTD